MPSDRGRGAVALSRWLFEPRLRLAWSAASAVLLAWLLGFDLVLRGDGFPILAPTAEDLWLATGLGAALGAVGIGLERFQLTHRRAENLAFHRADLCERITWRHQWGNLLGNGWYVVLLIALPVWCAYSGILPFAPILAVNAVMPVGNLRLAARFRAELEGERRATKTRPDLRA